MDGDAIPRFKTEARFYQALVSLAGGKTAEARTLLQAISAQSLEPWKSEAGRVLRDMETSR